MADQTDMARRVIMAAAGLIGAIGVMAAAGASHGGETRNLGAIASIGLAHGPALLALALASRGWALDIAAAMLALGTAIFIADLGSREFFGQGLFPGAAPLGGGIMILGWLAVVVAALGRRR